MRLLFISPAKLFESSFLAGTIFVLAAAVLLADLTIIAMRGYAFNLVSSWTLREDAMGLDGLSFSIMVALMWHVTLFFLVVDLLFTLLLPSRDLQDGAVISFGIISIMQIPLVTFFLKNELSWSSQVWLINACNLNEYSDDCPNWWSRVKVVSITTSVIVGALHLFLFGLAARYVHTRPATKQDMIAKPFRPSHKSRSRSKKHKTAKPVPAPPPAFPAATTYYSGESSSEGGAPLQRSQSDRASIATLPSYPPPPPPPGFSDFSSGEEKQPLSLGRRSSRRR
ncbi:hypothetical protein JCM6882_001548 [Rhodosporidiobolus microsporus]